MSEAKLRTLQEIAASVGNYAQAMLEMCGHQGVGHIVILVNNLPEGGSDQITATNVDPESAVNVLEFVASKLAGVAASGEQS